MHLRLGLLTLGTVLVGMTPMNASDTPKPKWLGSKEGISDRVLPPWTPVEVVQERGKLQLKVWGRTYEFHDSPFPSQIETRGAGVLSAPITLKVKVNNKEIVWETGVLRLGEKTPARASFSVEVASADKTLRLTAQTAVEYDGVVRTDWQLGATKTVQIQEAVFEICLPEERAKYFCCYRDYLHGIMPRGGALKPGTFSMRFNPLLWFCDDDRGLTWFCESDRNWFNAQAEQAIQISHDQGQVVLRLRLIDKPTALTANCALDYTFGLQGTPVRPIEKNQWDYRIVTAPNYRHECHDYDMLKDPTIMDSIQQQGARTMLLIHWGDILAYPAPVGHEEEFRKLVKELHKRGLKVIVYIGNQMSESAPEWKEHGASNLTAVSGHYADKFPGKDPQWMNFVCWNSPLQDFLADRIARLFDDYDIDGVYYDGTICASVCNNRSHGCGYVAEGGKVKETYQMFAYREFARRLYTLMKTRKPEAIIDVHTANFMSVPSLAYATSNWDGEWFDTKIFTEDSGPLDILRAQFTGRQLGLPVDFIYYYALPRKCRAATGYALLHDIPVRAHGGSGPDYWDDLKLLSQMWRIFDEFGRKEAEWLPYWKNSAYVTVETADTFVSLHRHPANGVLAVVSNLGKQRAQVKVNFRPTAFGLPRSCAAVDAFTKEPLAMKDAELVLELEAVDWRLVWIRPGQR